MKYNVFARPMFKRGGMSQGTGITSGLDTPRRNFQYGKGLAYGQQNFPDKKPSTIEEATKAVAGPTSEYKDALLDYWPYKEGDKFGEYDFWPTVPKGTRLDPEGKIIQEKRFWTLY